MMKEITLKSFFLPKYHIIACFTTWNIIIRKLIGILQFKFFT